MKVFIICSIVSLITGFIVGILSYMCSIKHIVNKYNLTYNKGNIFNIDKRLNIKETVKLSPIQMLNILDEGNATLRKVSLVTGFIGAFILIITFILYKLDIISSYIGMNILFGVGTFTLVIIFVIYSLINGFTKYWGGSNNHYFALVEAMKSFENSPTMDNKIHLELTKILGDYKKKKHIDIEYNGSLVLIELDENPIILEFSNGKTTKCYTIDDNNYQHMFDKVKGYKTDKVIEFAKSSGFTYSRQSFRTLTDKYKNITINKSKSQGLDR